MTAQGPMLCFACTRLNPDAQTCTAYPQGIPDDIIEGADHHEPRGDEVDGLVFEEDPSPAAEVPLSAWEATHDAPVPYVSPAPSQGT